MDRRRVALLLILSVALAAAALTSPARALAALREVVRSPWFPALLVGVYLVRPLLGWPISLVSVLVGYRYGVLPGFPVALAGAVFTTVPAYVVASRTAFDSGWLGRFSDGGERYFDAVGDFRGLLAARMTPTPAEAVSGAAGLADVPPSTFLAATLLGEVPYTVAAVLAGASLDALAAEGLRAASDPLVAVACLACAFAMVAPPAYRTYLYK